VLHCDRVSWFRHIEAPTVRSVVQALIVSGDNGLNGCSGIGWRFVAARLVPEGSYHKRLPATVGFPLGISVDRKIGAWATAALLLSTLTLGGCSTSIADMPLVGTPADAPERPKEAGAYLPVNNLPPDREAAAMSPEERAKMQAELLAARDRQASTAAAQNAAGK
jgi:hypothetical protein